MSSADESASPSCELSQARRIDDVCSRFEAAWRAGQRPCLETFLAELPPSDQPALLRELVRVEAFHRRRGGEVPCADDYIARFSGFDPAWLVATGTMPPEPQTVPEAIGVRSDTRNDRLPAVPGYELLGVLGRGGMGMVYKARQLSLGRIVALKRVRAEYLDDPSLARRFRREVEAIARLNHPNVVAAHDALRVGDDHFLVMEYVEGLTLADWLKRHGPLPVAEACDFARQTALGLQHAFEKGLVHRDIKPGNLMVETSSAAFAASPRIRVMDFGLASLVVSASGADGTGMTSAGIILGTLDYLAPEQAQDAHSADVRADLYSLGCTLFHMLTSQPPFPGGSLPEKLLRHQHESPPAVESLRPDVPPSLTAVVHKLLAKRPEERYATPAEVVAALTPYALASPTQVNNPPPAPPTRPRRISRRVVLLAGAFVLASGGAAGLLLRQRGWFSEGNGTGDSDHVLPHGAPVRCLAFHPIEGLLATGTDDGQGVIWDLSRREIQKQFTDLGGGLLAMAFTSDGKELRLARKDGRILVRTLDESPPGKLLYYDELFSTSNIVGLAFSHDGSLAASQSRNGNVLLVNLTNRQVMGNLPRHNGNVLALAFSFDGKTLAAGGIDRTIHVSSTTPTGRTIILDAPEEITALAFTPDGDTLASGTGAGPINLWNVSQGEVRNRCEGHKGPVTALAYDAIGSTFASADRRGEVRLWKAGDGTLLHQWSFSTPVHDLAFAPTAHLLAVATESGEVHLVRLPE